MRVFRIIGMVFFLGLSFLGATERSFAEGPPTGSQGLPAPTVNPNLPRGRELIEAILQRVEIDVARGHTEAEALARLRAIFIAILEQGHQLTEFEEIILQRLLLEEDLLFYFKSDLSKATGSRYLIEFGASGRGINAFRVFIHECAHAYGELTGIVAEQYDDIVRVMFAELHANLIAFGGDLERAFAFTTQESYRDEWRKLIAAFPELRRLSQLELYFVLEMWALSSNSRIFESSVAMDVAREALREIIQLIRAHTPTLTLQRILQPLGTTGVAVDIERGRALQKITFSVKMRNGKIIRVIGFIAIPLDVYLTYREFRDAESAEDYINAFFLSVGIIPTPHTVVFSLFVAIGNIVSEISLVPLVEGMAQHGYDHMNNIARINMLIRKNARLLEDAIARYHRGEITYEELMEIANSIEYIRLTGIQLPLPPRIVALAEELVRDGILDKNDPNFWRKVWDEDRRRWEREQEERRQEEERRRRAPVQWPLDLRELNWNAFREEGQTSAAPAGCGGSMRVVTDPARVLGPCDLYVPSRSPVLPIHPACAGRIVPVPNPGRSFPQSPCHFSVAPQVVPGLTPPLCGGEVRIITDPSRSPGPCEMFVPRSSPITQEGGACLGAARIVTDPRLAIGPCDIYLGGMDAITTGAPVCVGEAKIVTDPRRPLGPCEVRLPEGEKEPDLPVFCGGIARPVEDPADVRGPCDVYLPPEPRVNPDQIYCVGGLPCDPPREPLPEFPAKPDGPITEPVPGQVVPCDENIPMCARVRRKGGWIF